ncbi:hypothetical protein LINPERHAP1_LOCUS19017, partial [Linum perenne]
MYNEKSIRFLILRVLFWTIRFYSTNPMVDPIWIVIRVCMLNILLNNYLIRILYHIHSETLINFQK